MANSRMHWRTKDNKRKGYELFCLVCGEISGSEQIPMPRAHISATLYVWSLMDGDNLMARLKWPVDWLVKSGYIVDDGPKYLEWEMPKQAIDRKNMRVEIELEEA